MTVQTVFLKRQRVSNAKFRLIVSYFCLDFTALVTVVLTRLKRHTVEKYYTWFRGLIFKESLKEEKLGGEIEVDESYFGATRVRGKKGRGAMGKIPIVGLLKEMVRYTQRLF